MNERPPLRCLLALLLVLGLCPILGCGDGEETRATSGPVAWALAVTDSNEGVVLRSDDRALTWSVAFRTPERLDGIAFANRDHGSAVGSGLFHTTDGGVSWTMQTLPLGPLQGFLGIAFAGFRGVMVWVPSFFSGPLTSYTRDGGSTWNPSEGVPSGSRPFRLQSICILPSGTALGVGSGGFNSISSYSFALSSGDGAITWTDISARLPPNRFVSDALKSVACTNSDELWIVGQHLCRPFCNTTVEPLVVYHSSTGGRSWQDLSSRAQRPVGPGSSGLRAVTFIDPSDGWAVGFADGESERPPRALVLRTTHRGTRWTRQFLPEDPVGTLSAVAFANPKDGITLGYTPDQVSLAFVTGDGGLTWRSLRFPADVVAVTDVTFVD